jgi:hypothetical protein
MAHRGCGGDCSMPQRLKILAHLTQTITVNMPLLCASLEVNPTLDELTGTWQS